MDGQNDLRARIMAIMRDSSLTDAEKAVKRQEVMSGKWAAPPKEDEKENAKPGMMPKACLEQQEPCKLLSNLSYR